ncbi:MAG: response regulator, partial [Alphaproteobacteria bacterium]
MADRHSTIIIVDDRVTNRKVLAGLATNIEPGIEVETFPEAESALKHLGQHVPDLIVTDFNMPGMNGAEFIRALRKLPRCGDVPVVVVTSYEDKEYRLLALDAGATDYLISPVDHREFTSRARNLLALRRQRDARERAEL